jgi:hypothetical protein
MPPPDEQSSRSWVSEVIDVLEVQHRQLSLLRPLADRQGQLIRDGQADGLLELLAARQRIVDDFLATQAELERLAGPSGLASRLAEVPQQQRRRIRLLASAIDEEIAAVTAIDREDQRALRTSRDEARRELAMLGRGRSAHHAYTGPSGPTNRYADKQG